MKWNALQKQSSTAVLALGLLVAATAFGAAAATASDAAGPANMRGPEQKPTVVFDIPVTTQAPAWPPAEIGDENGDFVVVGGILTEVQPGVVVPIRGAAIVSKETVPPLDENGREDFTNIFGAPYQVVRNLDLSPGSPDLDIVLYSLSFGPAEGNFGGAGRVPMEGESTYNLNSLPAPCLDVFPSSSQRFTYRRESRPLHDNIINGFQGDQVAYDADTGDPYDPMLRSGTGCGAGCSGENVVDFSPFAEPITLGSWMQGKARVQVRLTDWDAEQGAYTAAEMKFHFKGLVPNGIYTIWMARFNVAANQGLPEFRQPDPADPVNVVIADSNGNAKKVVKVPNLFPAPEMDDAGTRLLGIAVDFHSDHQNWGACFSRLSAGVDIHAQFGIFDPTVFDGLVTVPPQNSLALTSANWFEEDLFADQGPAAQE